MTLIAIARRASRAVQALPAVDERAHTVALRYRLTDVKRACIAVCVAVLQRTEKKQKCNANFRLRKENMTYTITIERDGSGYLDIIPFGWMSRAAQEALNGPVALNGAPAAGRYTIDDDLTGDRFVVRKADGEYFLDYTGE
jgi:hypothetical protein